MHFKMIHHGAIESVIIHLIVGLINMLVNAQKIKPAGIIGVHVEPECMPLHITSNIMYNVFVHKLNYCNKVQNTSTRFQCPMNNV